MRRRLAAVVGIAGGLTLLAGPIARAGTDFFSNVGPASPLASGAAYARYPFSHYELDRHFTVISASITGGIDASGVLPAIAWFLASWIWMIPAFLSKVTIELFAFAFSLDLVNGSSATGGAGALGPVSQAIHSIYANVFGAPWLVLAFSAVAIWAMWKALVQRRYSETAGALALSLIYIVVALFFVAEPGQTIGRASQWTNQMSQAFLSIPAHGTPTEGEAATADDSDQLWSLLVTQPWTVLEFGGLEHCALDGTGDENSDPESAPVRPLSEDAVQSATLSRQLTEGTEVTAEGKTCINNQNKYDAHFLRFADGGDDRNEEYEALNHGNSGEVPEADPERSGYKLAVPDKPATDAMEEGGQYQRLLMAPVIALGDLGTILLLGALSIGVVLSQVLLLLLLAFSPVALVAAAIPGRGHDFFKAWLGKLGGYLLRKAAYSLVLAVLLAVDAAISGATSQLGWLFSYGLQAAFFWAVLIQRRTLTDGIVGVATGRAGQGSLALDAVALYGGARLGLGTLRGARRAGGSALGRLRGGNRDPRRRVGEARVSHAVDWSGGGADGPTGPGPGGGGNGPGGPEITGPGGGGESGGGPEGTGGRAGPDRKGRGPVESSAVGSTGESVAVPLPTTGPEAKAAGSGGEATHGRRVLGNRAQDDPSATAGTSSGSVAGSPSDPKTEVEATGDGDEATDRRKPAESRAQADEHPHPSQGRSPRRDARPRPESREVSGGQQQPGGAVPKGSDLSDDLRADRERVRGSAPSSPVAAGAREASPREEAPPRDPDASAPPDEPRTPPRRRRRLRLWRRRGGRR